MIEKKNNGVIYILTNPSFPEYVKIGYADDLQKRLKELNRSECIPFAFRVYAVYEVAERLQDKAIHAMIDNLNPNLRAIDTFDGKKRTKEFFAMTVDDAYNILQTIANISGTADKLHKLTPEGKAIAEEKIAEEIENNTTYFESDLLSKGDTDTVALYNQLKAEIIKFDNVSVQPKKLYVAFKFKRNFADIQIQKQNLKIFLNMNKGTLKDPEGFAADMSTTGHWGNGDYCVRVTDKSQIEYTMKLIKQSYENNLM